MNIYTVYVNYFATGEGMHVYYSTIRATDKREAIDQFRTLFDDFEDNDSWEFFSQGLTVEDGIKIPDELGSIFNEHMSSVIWLQPSIKLEVHIPSAL